MRRNYSMSTTAVLSEPSFLEKLPAALDTATKLMLEVAVFDIRSIAIAYGSLETAAAPSGQDGGWTIGREDSLSMVLDCWSIVDRSYSLFKALEKLPAPFVDGIADELIANFKPQVSTMRNFMDHSASRVPQLGDKTSYNPLLGHVIFYIGELYETLGPEVWIARRAVTVLTGTHHHGSLLTMAIHPNEPMAGRVGNFWFGAAETECFLTGLVSSLTDFASRFDDNARGVVEAAAQRQAEASGESLENLLRPGPRVVASKMSWD